MATSVHVPAAHAVPSAFGSFSGGSPRGVELEDRLDRSLDALIKDRKKEEKAKKREEVTAKTKKPAPTVKTTQLRKAQRAGDAAAVKTQQTTKRNAIVSKNRGLPVVPAAATTSNAAKIGKKAARQTVKAKTSITEITAQLRRKMRVTKSGGQQRASVKNTKKTATANLQRVVRKQDNPVAKKPNTETNQKLKKQQQQLSTSGDAHQPAKTKERSVVRADSKKGKLKITFKNPSATKPRQSSVVKKILPGKRSVQTQKQPKSPKKASKLAKKARKHQASAPVVVRQPFASRKKN